MPQWVWTVMIIAGALGMAAGLYGMYGDKRRGFPALTALDSGFSSLDMRWRYTAAEVFACFDGVGQEGQRLLSRLWKIDDGFVICFWMVMAAVSRNISRAWWIFWVMMAAAALRALLDIIENCLLLRVCGAYPAKRLESMAKAAGMMTAAKWVMMALWVVCLFGNLMLSAFAMTM